MEGTIPRSVAIGDAVVIVGPVYQPVVYGIVREDLSKIATPTRMWCVQIVLSLSEAYSPSTEEGLVVSEDRLLVLNDEHATAIRLMK